MLFPTFTFALFFVVVLTVGWLVPGRRAWWKLFMLAASYVFYGYWDARFVGLIVASTVLNQAAAASLGRLRRPGARRAVVSLAVGVNLASLGFFKYAGFFVDSAERALEGLGVAADLPLLNIILPVGISFFTFQAISYVLDVYRGDAEPAKPLDFAVYLAFFPQLVAGPIVRAHELIPQINHPRALRHTDFTRAITLIAAGLFKKMVVATYLADALVDDVFAFPDRFSSLEVLMGGLRLRGADLRRLQRLHRHRHRGGAAAGHPATRQLRPAVPGNVYPGLLAALAHVAVALAARLPLHPPRRQPRRPPDGVTATCS